MNKTAYKGADLLGRMTGLEFPFNIGQKVRICNLDDWRAHIDEYLDLKERKEHWKRIAREERKRAKQFCQERDQVKDELELARACLRKELERVRELESELRGEL